MLRTTFPGLTVEDLREVLRQRVLDLRDLHRPPQLALDRGDPGLLDPAGDDQPEVREIGVHVEREAVTRLPTGDVHPDRRDLPGVRRGLLADPHPRPFRNPPRGNAEARHRADHRLFQIPHVLAHVLPIPGELEDGVAHHLPGAVVRDVAAAAGLEDLEAARPQLRLGEEDVLGPRVQTQYKQEWLGDLFTADLLFDTGVLRPEAGIAVVVPE